MRKFPSASVSVLLAAGTLSLQLAAGALAPAAAAAASPRITTPVGTQLAELKGSDTFATDGFGFTVAISGSSAIVGGFLYRAYVFTETAGGWKQAAELAGSDTVSTDGFGFSVAISGTTAIVGAPYKGAFPVTDAGRAYVFTKTAGGWKQAAELVGSDTVAGDNFGTSVAISGNTAIVGAPYPADDAGRAYVFTETGGAWKQAAELKGSDSVADDYFGSSVGVSGTTAVVGAWGHDNSAGRAYVFTEAAGGWKQVAELKGSNTGPGNNFGSSVAISGNTAVVGAPYTAVYAGRVYVFTDTASGWKQAEELKGSDTVAVDNFGSSVAVSGSTVAVGAWGHSASAGRAYVFARTASGWTQTADVTGSDTRAGDEFGWCVAVSGTTAIVGSPYIADTAGRAYVIEA